MAQMEGNTQPESASQQPYVFKVVLLGSSSVGKSSLAFRLIKNDFKEILPTLGCAFFTQMMEIDGSALKLEIWDTAGQEKYHSVCHLYFRGANAAVLVYDIADKDSFRRAQNWWKELENEFQPEEIVVILVGNKTDLEASREVTLEEGKAFAESKKLLFMETSAKLNYQVTEAFIAVARELLRREEENGGQSQQRSPSVDLKETARARKGKCCQD
ncbi:ras-related protein Rab-17 [Vombatus ursinus]|uniref:Ras-related protein Rab-17 n=1 Tax=Vombatus ursinus TaxID=29139 RepID=A0A4X2M6R8_VOMUR|nr:ras-related protein Rab-17 [Vombatus ursinus]XP_027731035.1 ras-related protein Rab-17 [Vombatus ursinus]